MTRAEILEYELANSWWAGLICFDWIREVTAQYFAWKVCRKWDRYQRTIHHPIYKRLKKESEK